MTGTFEHIARSQQNLTEKCEDREMWSPYLAYENWQMSEMYRPKLILHAGEGKQNSVPKPGHFGKPYCELAVSCPVKTEVQPNNLQQMINFTQKNM